MKFFRNFLNFYFVLFVCFSTELLRASKPTQLACVVYDRENNDDLVGAIHAHMLENLLGAFPSWSTLRFKAQSENFVELIQDCDALFYLATHFSSLPPEGGLDALVEFSQKKILIWFHYKLEFYEATFREKFPNDSLGFSVGQILQMDQEATPTVPDGGFYRYFEYKGEEFEKNARWDLAQNRLAVNPEIVDLRLLHPVDPNLQVYSWARHSKKVDLKTPYALKKKFNQGGKLWVLGDSPFSFVDYGDRYFVFTDLLWDILEIPNPPAGPLGALVRLEDINPSMNSEHVRWAVDYLATENVPFSAAVIPYFSSPHGRYSPDKRPIFKPADEFPSFKGILRYLKARNADFVFHGVAHQAGSIISGYDAISGSDYEFWLYPENTPMPQDSSDWVLNRLELGENIFLRNGIKPVAWEVPHYAASVLDYILFGKVFEWNFHRPINFVFDILEKAPLESKHLMFECLSDECRDERRRLARKLDVEADYRAFGGQIIPYRVYKDTFGQAIIPETLGMVDYLMYPSGTWRPVSKPEDVLKRAKQMRVVRGSFASFFWHPSLLDPKARFYEENPESYLELDQGRDTLRLLVEGIKDLGYEFKSISDCELFPRRDCVKNLK
jgi:uncharacterized protein YdaL